MCSVQIGLKPQHQTAFRLQTDPTFLDENLDNGYSVFLLSITNQSYKQVCKNYFQSWSSQNHSDYSLDFLHVPHPKIENTDISTGDHIQYTVGLISSWIELDSDDIVINEFSFQVFYNEISFANYLGIKTFMLSPPKNVNNMQIFSSNILKLMDLLPSINITISLPISQDLQDKDTSFYDSYSTWEMWNSIRLNCNYHPNLSVSLGAPKSNIPSSILDRWLLEPIKFYLISASRFLPNGKSYPVLHKFNQLIIWKLIQYKTLNLPIFLLHGIDKNVNDSNLNVKELNSNDKSTYLSYIQHLISISYKTDLLPYMYSFTLSALKKSNISSQTLSSPFILQSPLEPIIENLENLTYKVFEQDTFKYEQYERAIIKALIDLQKNWISNTKPHILFLGPGRGPLIQRFFSALKFLSISPSDFIITAIERNPNVMIMLNQRNIQQWNSHVNILNVNSNDYVNLQYRLENPPFNMVISELIGSFGCNELMPECIDSISTNELCNSDCIFIPQDLHCYVSPVYSPKLWKLASSTSTDKLYVPMIPEMETLLDFPQEVWKFVSKVSHSSHNSAKFSYNSNKHNSRQCRVALKPNRKGSIHGLAGFFSSTLYADIGVSNIPKPPGIDDSVSWLPAFLPFEQPLNLYDGHEVSLFIKRVCSSDSVWYEWSVECFLYMLIPNSSQKINTPPTTPSPDPVYSNTNTTTSSNNNNNNISKLPPFLLMSRSGSEKTNEEKQSEEMDKSMNHSTQIYDDVSLHPTKSANDGHSSRSNISSDYKVRVSTGISRVHNVNGSGFKFRLR
ncbi:methyltransferase protein [Pichia californica]|uniref:Methyltransferase protein n=1 Tax=Pichia californica TaxID=460514 RepID=A0A9P6WKN0_9ASCO|nr:methyltransferase protein [[Candida] californica]